MKKCSRCKKDLDVSLFNKNKRYKDGYDCYCRNCSRERQKDRFHLNKQYNENNKENISLYNKNYYQNNKEEINKKRKENPNLLKNNDRKKVWYEKNKEKIILNQNIRLKTDSLFKFNYSIRGVVRSAFKRGCKGKFKKSDKSENILGCTLQEFIEYLQSLFTDGMTLENHGEWHIDHKIPIASAKTEGDIIRLNHYSNLQPLWAKDNYSKGSRYIT